MPSAKIQILDVATRSLIAEVMVDSVAVTLAEIKEQIAHSCCLNHSRFNVCPSGEHNTTCSENLLSHDRYHEPHNTTSRLSFLNWFIERQIASELESSYTADATLMDATASSGSNMTTLIPITKDDDGKSLQDYFGLAMASSSGERSALDETTVILQIFIDVATTADENPIVDASTGQPNEPLVFTSKHSTNSSRSSSSHSSLTSTNTHRSYSSGSSNSSSSSSSVAHSGVTGSHKHHFKSKLRQRSFSSNSSSNSSLSSFHSSSSSDASSNSTSSRRTLENHPSSQQTRSHTLPQRNRPESCKHSTQKNMQSFPTNSIRNVHDNFCSTFTITPQSGTSGTSSSSTTSTRSDLAHRSHPKYSHSSRSISSNAPSPQLTISNTTTSYAFYQHQQPFSSSSTAPRHHYLKTGHKRARTEHSSSASSTVTNYLPHQASSFIDLHQNTWRTAPPVPPFVEGANTLSSQNILQQLALPSTGQLVLAAGGQLQLQLQLMQQQQQRNFGRKTCNDNAVSYLNEISQRYNGHSTLQDLYEIESGYFYCRMSITLLGREFWAMSVGPWATKKGAKHSAADALLKIIPHSFL